MQTMQPCDLDSSRPNAIQGVLPKRCTITKMSALSFIYLTYQKLTFAANDKDGFDINAFRISGEFEPTRAIWLGYNAGHSELTLALVRILKPHVALKLVAIDATGLVAARNLLTSGGISLDNIEFLVEPKSLFFYRDLAVFANASNGKRIVINMRWQYYGQPGWCKRRHGSNSDRLNTCIATALEAHNDFGIAVARQAGVPILKSNLILEGGAIEANGKGLILANESLCLQRNPGRNRVALENEYLALPGVRKVIWLPEGLAEDPLLRATIIENYVAWGTGGHTDEFIRFTDARTVMLAWPDDVEVVRHPVAKLNRRRMQRSFDILSKATDTDGKPLRVLKVPMPKIIERPIFLSATADGTQSAEWSADFFPASERRREGDRVIQVASASYMNFIIANGVVVVPSYVAHGTARSTEARVIKMFEVAFPGRQIQLIDAIGANWVGGGPHCATLREPA
jgi:agmatine deiminase